jgi:hypothetical protein
MYVLLDLKVLNWVDKMAYTVVNNKQTIRALNHVVFLN